METSMTTSATGRHGVGDFDFLIGTWHVANRRLLAPLSGASEWDEFPATAICHSTLFRGAANLDEITFPSKGFSGLTLRLYDPLRRQWSLNWVNSGTGQLSPPVLGRFHDGRGEFHGLEVHDGVTVPCRFLWFGITAETAHWEQAFSPDAGASWETNWTMDFARVA
jgi:hypothetical protein